MEKSRWAGKQTAKNGWSGGFELRIDKSDGQNFTGVIILHDGKTVPAAGLERGGKLRFKAESLVYNMAYEGVLDEKFIELRYAGTNRNGQAGEGAVALTRK